MTRALHITRDFPPRWIGGLSTAVGQMVESLAGLGVDCAVISFDDWRPRARPGGDELVVEERCGAQVARLRGPAALDSAAEFAHRFAPTVIHAHHAMLWPFAARLRTELSAPAMIKSVHVAQVHQNRLRGLERTASSDAQAAALAEADAIIAPSPAAAEILSADHPGIDGKMAVLPLGTCDTLRAKAASVAPGKRDDSLILYAGRFADINGTAEFFSALPEILLRRPAASAVIAGGLPANRKAEAKWRRRFGDRVSPDIAGRVRFAGWLAAPELSELYATCGVLVSPSWFETFGLVVLEGMLHGAPVAASRSGGAETTIRHLQSGYLFEPRSVPAIVEAVCALLDDRVLARRLGARAAAVARADFLWSSIAPRLRELYE